MFEFLTTVFTWIGFLVVYVGLVLLVARFCGIGTRYDDLLEERDRDGLE